MGQMNDIGTTIKVRGLFKHFGDFPAVAGIDFDVYPGEIFGFLGPNGSGKTTTIRMMLGLLQPTSGEIEVLGIPVIENPEQIRPRVGYMSQRFSLYNDLTVIQNLRFYGRAYGIDNALLNTRIQAALEMAGLKGREHAKTKDLAGGWRQRLALSVAIMHHPEVIFLDEPTAGVDPVSRREFWDLLYDLVSGGVTVFVTTHYMDEAEHCHRLAFIQDGKIIAYGAPDEIKDKTLNRQVLEISPSEPGKAIIVLEEAKQSGKLHIDEVELYGSLVHVFSQDMKKREKEIKSLLGKKNIEVTHSAIIEPSLEDVFIACMKEGVAHKHLNDNDK
jgi:ABC-2 type transport system ATP-binding protein